MNAHCMLCTSLLLASLVPAIAQPSPSTISPQAHNAILDSESLVRSIYHFYDQCGLWPQYLDDLVLQDKLPADTTWRYEFSYEGYIKLRRNIGQHAQAAVFEAEEIILVVNGDEAGWYAGLPGAYHFANIPIPSPSPPEFNREILTNAIAEFKRRITREPHNLSHYIARSQYLLEAQAIPEALEATMDWCVTHLNMEEARAALRQVEQLRRYGLHENLSSGYRWIHMSLDRRLKLESADHSTFAAWRILVYPWYGTLGQEQLIPRMKQPLYSTAIDWLIIESAMCKDSSMLVARTASGDDRQYAKDALFICKRWEAGAQTITEVPVDKSYHAIRAAAHLVLGDYGPSETALSQAMEADRQRPLLCGILDELQSAVRRRDSSFQFEIDSEGAFDRWKLKLNCPPQRP